MNMELKPTDGFGKLQFLLQQNPFPPETFGNLLLLYCKYEYYDLAADVLAENAHLTYKYLTPYLYDFLEALITQVKKPDKYSNRLMQFYPQQTSPDEAYRKFDTIASKHAEQLRKFTKQVQEARSSHDDEAVKKSINDYEDALARFVDMVSLLQNSLTSLRYIPVLMAQAKIYWDMDQYAQVEKIFRKSVEFCSESDIWKLNVAHVLFMQVTFMKRI